MSFMTKPREEWTGADIAADQLRRRVRTVAERMRTTADRIERIADRVTYRRGVLPASRLAEAVTGELISLLSNSQVGDLAFNAADVDSRYAAEKRVTEGCE